MRPAEFAENLDQFTDCHLCPNRCRILEGRRGRCLGRGRKDGTMFLFNYGMVASGHLDPIEKKPLYHFFPGSSILSLGTYGCNLHCRFCQNCEISQNIVDCDFLSPQQVVEQAVLQDGNIGIAFTYNEPGIWYEYIMDCAPLLRERGMKVVLVTNGYLEPQPWENLCSVTDAMNIDLKSFAPEFYEKICGGKLQTVLDNISMAVKKGVHVELTNLVVTGLNSRQEEFEAMIDWVATLDPGIPFHISRYFPRFKETAPPTDPETLERFFEIAAKKLSFVYVGNCSSSKGNDTVCPQCGKIWIKRHGYQILPRHEKSVCTCGFPIRIPGLGDRKG